MHKIGICIVFVTFTGLKLKITTVYITGRENLNFMYVHLWAAQSMNQEFNSKWLKTVFMYFYFCV